MAESSANVSFIAAAGLDVAANNDNGVTDEG
jgi:hypothetical protein